MTKGKKKRARRVEEAAPPPSVRVPFLRRIVGILLLAVCAGSIGAFFIVPPSFLRNPGASAWHETHAFRCSKNVRYWGTSNAQRRLGVPNTLMGRDVFAFTQLWGGLLDEHLMPQTKCWDHTRSDHIAYLLPNTGRRPIPPPPGEDRRPPVLVGYDLKPEQLKARAFMGQNESSGTIVLDEGHSIGQSFCTIGDYDTISAVTLQAPADVPLPPGDYTVVLYSTPTKKRELARTTNGFQHMKDGRCYFLFEFKPPVRLKYGRGSTPYLFEITWERPEGVMDPAPVFSFVERDALPLAEMFVDGEREAGHDLAFCVAGCHTDVSGYVRLLPMRASPDEPEWLPFFFAVRRDVLQRMPDNDTARTVPEFFERLNKVLLEL